MPPHPSLTPDSSGGESTILCVGEILWDALPDGLFLGGAPFNVAAHLRALGQTVAFASRVGDDQLGREARRRVGEHDLDPDLLQIDDTHPTGFVRVDVAPSGDPEYEIVEPAAWDGLTLTDALRAHARRTTALVYGSLAQRASPSRETIEALRRTDSLCVFDVNLRPPFVDRTVIEASLRDADVVKLNDDELRRLAGWFAFSDDPDAAMAELASTFDCTTVCVTRGREGARLWHRGAQSHHPGYAVGGVDAVGAGDAFLAALLAGLLDGRDGKSLLALANRLGAYVASRPGALPPHEIDGLDEIKQLPLDATKRSEQGQ